MQNAFEITYFFWIWVIIKLIASFCILVVCIYIFILYYIWHQRHSKLKAFSRLLMQYEFGLRSCFHDNFVLTALRVALGYVDLLSFFFLVSNLQQECTKRRISLDHKLLAIHYIFRVTRAKHMLMLFDCESKEHILDKLI